MSYGEFDAPQKRAAGCNPVILIVIAFAAFVLLRNTQQPGADRNLEGIQQESSQPLPQHESLPPQVQKHPDSGDWEMDELQASTSDHPKDSAELRTKGDANGDRNGDWKIEEVPLKGSLKAEPEVKKTENGDWAIEEVEKGK